MFWITKRRKDDDEEEADRLSVLRLAGLAACRQGHAEHPQPRWGPCALQARVPNRAAGVEEANFHRITEC